MLSGVTEPVQSRNHGTRGSGSRPSRCAKIASTRSVGLNMGTEQLNPVAYPYPCEPYPSPADPLGAIAGP